MCRMLLRRHDPGKAGVRPNIPAAPFLDSGLRRNDGGSDRNIAATSVHHLNA